MKMNEKIFHESWYQIANQRIALRSSVIIGRQMYRGLPWRVLHDPFTNQYFRFRPEVYEFIARLNKTMTVEEVWNGLLETMPEKAPTQNEVMDLLAQLYHANLLHYDRAPDSVKLFERYKKRRHNLMRMSVLNVMFARIPLFDPDAILKRMQRLIRLIISPVGLAIWFAMLILGIKTAIENASALQAQTDAILSASNLFLLYAATVIIKIIHEIGHAFSVRRFGGEVHTLGVMLMVLTPLPYTDATAAWAFRSKWKRIFVSGAGMIFELFIASVAILVWAQTGDGVIHSLAYNMIFIASISTLIFNLNPLLRYDGYYILSDLLDIPNLQQQSQRQLAYVLERYAFRKKDAVAVASNAQEAWLLSFYSITSSVYRVLVFGGILLFISTKMLLLAVIMAIFFTGSWAIYPLYKFIKYLFTSPGLSRVRGRAIRICGGCAMTITVFLCAIPFPFSFKSPGVLKAVDYVIMVNSTAGIVTTLGRPSGSRVRLGDTLMVLDNKELRLERVETESALREARLEFTKALNAAQADCEPIEKRIAAYTQRLHRIDQQITELTVRAQFDGIWASPDADDFIGRWMPRGTSMGQLINPDRFYFVSVIVQREIGELFSQQPGPACVRLCGQAQEEIPVTTFTTIPMEHNQLPSSALGFMGGGDIAISPNDSSGTRAVEPFYEVRALVGKTASALLLHGRSGKIRFSLGQKPLAWQGWRKVRQLIQKHYQI
jgi:putative peptide zinc metalloprotease protein